MSMFSMLYDLFHHTPRMIFDPFLVTWHSRDILALHGGDTKQSRSASRLVMFQANGLEIAIAMHVSVYI